MSPETKALIRLVIENASRIDHALRLAADDCARVAGQFKASPSPHASSPRTIAAFEGYAEGFQALRPVLEDAVDAWNDSE